MEGITLRGKEKERYLDDMLRAFYVLDFNKLMNGRLSAITTLYRVMHLKDEVDVCLRSGFVTKESMRKLIEDTPLLEKDELNIEEKRIYGRTLSLFEFPMIENQWLSYAVTFDKVPEKSSEALMKLDHSHLKDADNAWHYFSRELKMRPLKLERNVLGPFITGCIPGAEHGVIGNLMADRPESWLLAYKEESIIRTGDGGLFSRNVPIESSTSSYIVCSGNLYHELMEIFPKKRIARYLEPAPSE
ncbi:MAG TPA: hypothetical protein VJC00_02930 [Candidatus Nanoarchaeia archaeon]|nr:hypothetical protein [Candidatus Nanoarchaeia archaeon]